jgi:hypothetical protein
MLALILTTLIGGAPDVAWHTDYDIAYPLALKEKKDLLIHFRDDTRLDAALADPEVVKRLRERYICFRAPTDFSYRGEKFLAADYFADMQKQPGLAIISLHNKELATHRHVISVHPLVRSRYTWAPEYGAEQIKVILDLPAHGSLSQRSMIYAVRVHPERPQSTNGEAHVGFLAHAERHSARQAAMQHQHHADLISALNGLGGGFGNGSEVVAESWGAFVGGENVLEAAFSCIDAWRHSPGHWGAVSRTHRLYGYDVARGPNGTWYATGIFAD